MIKKCAKFAGADTLRSHDRRRIQIGISKTGTR